MLSELINEIFDKTKQENASEKSINITSKKVLNHGLEIENFEVITKTENMDKGHYTILNFKNLFFDVTHQTYLIKHLTSTLKKYLNTLNTKKILIVGLGNRHISADSLGAKVVGNIIVTRHIKGIKTLKNVSVIAPSVLGLTGIESFDIVNGVINEIRPTLVITIDSLCAINENRLGTSFQVNNASIIPGGGVNNSRKIFNKSTLNCDFLSIGVPLVIYANSFCKNPKRHLKNFVATLKDIEEVSETCANIISYSLNMAIHNLSFEETKEYLNKL